MEQEEVAGGLGTAGELKVGARECQFRWPVTKEEDGPKRLERERSDWVEAEGG